MIDIASFTVSTALNIRSMSGYMGSGYVQQAIYEPNYQATGSIKPSSDWLLQQAKSGQNFTIINQQVSSIGEKLELIKSVFFLSEEDLARIVGVGRKTLFNWKQQVSEPSKDKTQRVFDLYILAKNWQNSQYLANSFDMSTPILLGKSIKEMLSEKNLDSEKILFAGNRLAHQNIGEIDLI